MMNETLVIINGGLLLTIAGFLVKLSYQYGLLSQRVLDQSLEIERMRDRLDRFIDSQSKQVRES
jgi:hypothetical protein